MGYIGKETGLVPAMLFSLAVCIIWLLPATEAQSKCLHACTICSSFDAELSTAVTTMQK